MQLNNDNIESKNIDVSNNRDQNKILLYLEDQFFDIEITSKKFTAYRKKDFTSQRTGKVKEYCIDSMENINFEYPVTIFNFDYKNKKAVYSLNEKNYNSLKDLMIELGLYDPNNVVKEDKIDKNAALKDFIKKISLCLKRIN